MAGPAVRVYPRIGGQDGEELAAISFPTIDSAFVSVPTATYTQFKAQNTYMTGGGLLRINIEGTTYGIPLVTNA